MKTTRSRWLVLIAALGLICASALAQSISGDLVGTIYDSTGAVVPNAAIVATNVATGISWTATSTSSGQYRINNLPIGSYNVFASAKGFSKATIKDVGIELNKTSTINVTMRVGQTSSVVEVAEAAVAIDTTTAQVQTSFESRQLVDLPAAANISNSGAGVLNLSLLTSGVSSAGSVGLNGPSVGGQRPRDNNYTVEGIDNNDKSVAMWMVTIPNDAVAEFSIMENQFSAEFGHSSGGQFNQVVKSGTNAYHGTLYEYMQNRDLNAADNLNVVGDNPLHPRLDNNRFGGNFGGPIKKDKLFFFFDYEYNPWGMASLTTPVYAPTAAGYATLNAMPGLSQTNLSQLEKYLPAAPTAVAANLAPNKVYPVVNGASIPIGLLSTAAPAFENEDSGVASVDYNISDKDNLRGRFILNRIGEIDTVSQLSNFFTTEPSHYYLATFSEYHNFSPSITNEFRLGYNRYSYSDPVGNQTFPGLSAFPNIALFDLALDLGPDDNAPQSGDQNMYQATDNITWVKGAHTLQFGVNAEHFIAPGVFVQYARGAYYYNDMATYLMDDAPDYYAGRGFMEGGGQTYYGNQTELGVYANDVWKLKPNFTVDLGLRYEHNTVPLSEQYQDVNAIYNVPGLITFGAPKASNLNFEPRVGLAWSPGTSGNTSIRAGFGINYDQVVDNFGMNALVNVVTNNYSNTNFLANGGITGPGIGSLGTPTEYIPDTKPPESIQWNIDVQHVFAQNYTLDVRYLGTRGLFLAVQDQINVQSVVTPQNALPLFYSTPSQATLNSLTSTLGSLSNTLNNGNYGCGGSILPAFAAAGFCNPITDEAPMGSSTYHGLATQLTRRMSNDLQFVAAWTWSHNIDDATAEVHTTDTTPRRPEDFQNLDAERASSALDHRHRISISAVYNAPFFSHSSNWIEKNVIGNWTVTPVYIYQTGSWATVQSATDANLNNDPAGDRAFVNPNGVAGTGSGSTPIDANGNPIILTGNPTVDAALLAKTVAYVANNPNAQYIQAGAGQLPNGGRNTVRLAPINDVDLCLTKNFNVNERMKFQFGAQFSNLFNHPQYTGSYVNDIATVNTAYLTSPGVLNSLTPGTSSFLDPNMAFSSNPRLMQLTAKFTF